MTIEFTWLVQLNGEVSFITSRQTTTGESYLHETRSDTERPRINTDINVLFKPPSMYENNRRYLECFFARSKRIGKHCVYLYLSPKPTYSQ